MGEIAVAQFALGWQTMAVAAALPAREVHRAGCGVAAESDHGPVDLGRKPKLAASCHIVFDGLARAGIRDLGRALDIGDFLGRFDQLGLLDQCRRVDMARAENIEQPHVMLRSQIEGGRFQSDARASPRLFAEDDAEHVDRILGLAAIEATHLVGKAEIAVFGDLGQLAHQGQRARIKREDRGTESPDRPWCGCRSSN